MSTRILLGITGSIAAYKAPELIRLLKKRGHSVTPMVTKHATQFVTIPTLEYVAETRVYQDMFRNCESHVDLNRSHDICVIAPASANTIGKIANGIADEAVSTAILSFKGPKLVIPAMHTEMIENPAVTRNIQQLLKDKIAVFGPDTGDLLSGDTGYGRFPNCESIADMIDHQIDSRIDLSGKRITVTAGGTSEPIDPVRTITNRSTGMMGEQLARTAAMCGATVTLITSKPVSDPFPISKVIPIQTASDLQNALDTEMTTTDILYMAAAVSDFAPKASTHKLKRNGTLTLELDSTTDIVGTLNRQSNVQKIVGFCLEDQDLETVANTKLKSKKLDAIIANTSDMIGQTTRSAKIITKNGGITDISDQDLPNFCRKILEETTK